MSILQDEDSAELKWLQAREIARKVILHFEGERLDSYVLSGERWATIGVGVAIPLSQHPRKITKEQSEKMFNDALARKEKQLKQEIPKKILDTFNANALAGLLSWRYNVKDSLWLSSTCRTRLVLARGHINEFLHWHEKWIYAEKRDKPLAGLVRRRKVEHDLMVGKGLEDIKKVNWYQ